MFLLSGWAIPIIFALTLGNISDGNFVANSASNQTKILKPIPSVTKTPTLIPSPTPTLLPTPTASPTPTIAPVKAKSPTPTKAESNVVNPPTSDIPLTLLKQINDFRAGKGLSAFSTDGYTCSFAVTRANEIVNGFSHDGFRSRIDGNSLPYPSFTGVSENIAMNGDANAVVSGWINSPSHNENLSRGDKHACIGRSGDYFVFESWNP